MKGTNNVKSLENRMKLKGFTLTEIMLVVLVIGILLAILIPRVGTTIDKAREKACAKNLKNIQSAVTTYCVRPDEEVYPDTDERFEAILEQYFPQGIPAATLRRGAGTNNANCNKVRVGSYATETTNEGGWFLVTNKETPEAGRVFINSQEKDLYGEYYSSYPSW